MEKVYAEISPLSLDGEEMLKAIILPYGGKIVQTFPERDVALITIPDKENITQIASLPSYNVREVEKPKKEMHKNDKNDDTLVKLTSQVVNATAGRNDSIKSSSSSNENKTFNIDECNLNVSDRKAIHDSDPFYLLCNIHFFGPAVCLFLMGYTLLCLVAIL